MKISFMTLGCPKWDLDTICQKGRDYGFDGVDFRGYLDEIDVTKLHEFTIDLKKTRKKLDSAGLQVSAISSSINVCSEAKHADNIDEAKRTIEVAKGLNCGIVRVFGGGNVPDVGREKAAERGCSCMEGILALDGATDLLWVFETHDHWVKAADCKLLLDHIDNTAFGALWDMGHTYRVGGETPRESYAAIGSRIGYTHIKDAIRDESVKGGWRYVPPGLGELPLEESILLLKENGYDGWLQFEHEKRWHPELPEPEVVFPLFVSWIKAFID